MLLLNLSMFKIIFDAISYYCNEIDPELETDSRYLPYKLSTQILDSNEDSLIRESENISLEDTKSILLNLTHSISKCTSKSNVKINAKINIGYKKQDNENDTKDITRNVTLTQNMYFVIPKNIDSFFTDDFENKQYTYEWIIDSLESYVYDSTIVNKIKVAISEWRVARTNFISLFIGNGFNYGLPDYQSTVKYLDAYYDLLVQFISLLKEDSMQDLLNFGEDPNLLDIILNTDCGINSEGEFYISLFNPFILHLYFTSMIFASSQAWPGEINLPTKMENILYKINSDILMTQLMNNFNCTLFYKNDRYFIDSIYNMKEPDEKEPVKIGYFLKTTREDKLKSYTFIEPIRLYEKISTTIEYDLNGIKQLRIGIFGYFSKFSFEDLTDLLLEKFPYISLIFNFYKISNDEDDVNLDSNDKIKLNTVDKVFELNKKSIIYLYDNNDVVFFLDHPFLYKRTLEKNIKSNLTFLFGLHDGKYSNNYDMFSITNGLGGKYGDFISAYNYLIKLNNKNSSNFDIFNYIFDENKFNKFTTMLNNSERKVILYFFISGENAIDSLKSTTLNVCREEYFENKKITIIKAAKDDKSKSYKEVKIIPITLWQVLKSLSNTVYMSIWKEAKVNQSDIKRTEVVRCLSNSFIGVDYSRIDKIKIGLYSDENLYNFIDKYKFEKIISTAINEYFSPQKGIKNKAPVRTPFLKISIYYKIYTLLYNGCTSIDDILFAYLYNNYRHLLSVGIIETFSDEESHKMIKEKYDKRVFYYEKKEDYDAIQNFSVSDYYMFSKDIIKDIKGFKSDIEYKIFVKDLNALCTDINALDTNVYVNTSKELK